MGARGPSPEQNVFCYFGAFLHRFSPYGGPFSSYWDISASLEIVHLGYIFDKVSAFAKCLGGMQCT